MWDYLTPKDLAPAPAPRPRTPKVLTATLPEDQWEKILEAIETNCPPGRLYLPGLLNGALTTRPSPTIDALTPDEWAQIRAAVWHAVWHAVEYSSYSTIGGWARDLVRATYHKLYKLTDPITCALGS